MVEDDTEEADVRESFGDQAADDTGGESFGEDDGKITSQLRYQGPCGSPVLAPSLMSIVSVSLQTAAM